MKKLLKKLPDLLGKDWKGYVGGLVTLAGGVGLAADYLSQVLGMDLYERATTWPEVVTMLGAGLALLGIRHKQG